MQSLPNEKTLEILHFSVRYPRSKADPPAHPYFIHNVVWRAIDPDFKNLCISSTEEWLKTSVVFDTDKADEYFNGIRFEGLGEEDEDEEETSVESQFGYAPLSIVQKNGIRRDTIFNEAWQMQFPSITYIEKFDCFRHWGFTESNAITQGCVHDIEMLKLGEHMYLGRFMPWCHFRRVIETLDRFWD